MEEARVLQVRDDDRLSETLASHSTSHSDDQALDSQIWGGLADELVELIRAFLPPSSVFRFRCVCKRWNSLCSEPAFNKLYDGIAAPTPACAVIITSDDQKKRTAAFYLESSKFFQLPLDFLPKEATLLLAQAGGLLCLGASGLYRPFLWICNPLTKSWRRLPDCRLHDHCRSWDTLLVNMVVKDKATYKVVVIGDPSLSNTCSTVLKIYHSEKGLWTQHTHTLPIRSNLPSTSVIKDGVLYWCTMGPDGLHAYDLDKGSWSHSRVLFPHLFIPFGDAHLFEAGGRVGLMGLKLGGQSFSLGLWILEDVYGQAGPTAEWVAMPRRAMSPVLERQCIVHEFAHKYVPALYRARSLEFNMHFHRDVMMKGYGNVMRGAWLPGAIFPDKDLKVQHVWCPYEPRLDICA